MKQNIYEVLRWLNEQGKDNAVWGFVEDVSTTPHFGTRFNHHINGRALYYLLWMFGDDSKSFLLDSSPDYCLATDVPGYLFYIWLLDEK